MSLGLLQRNNKLCLITAIVAGLTARSWAIPSSKLDQLDRSQNAQAERSAASPFSAYCVGEANPGKATSDARLLTVFNGRIFFIANDASHGRELFAYDGQDVKLIADINHGSGEGYPSEFFVWKDQLLFRADDGLHGKELFIFDGQTMHMVDDFWKGKGYNPFKKQIVPTNGNPAGFFEHDGKVFFSAKTKKHNKIGNVGAELFFYEGNSIQLAKDFNPGPADSYPGYFTPINNGFVFTYRHPDYGTELFWIDRLTGSSEPKLIADIYPGKESSKPGWLTKYKDHIYFLAVDPEHGRELWRTDGKSAEMVMDISPGKKSSLASDFCVYRDQLIFRANDGTHGPELFRYDGQKVELRVDIWPGLKGSEPSQFFEYDGILYFGANGGPPYGRELYCYDGNNVHLALDINPGDGSGPNDFEVSKGHPGIGNGIPSDFIVYNDELYFVADDGYHGRELMKLTRPIWWIQGKSHRSPMDGRTVTTHGIVTGISFDGFWIQDPYGDGDPATSDAIYVDVTMPPTVKVGDEVRVRGMVAERASRPTELTKTCLIHTTYEVLSSDNTLPNAVMIGAGGRQPPTEVVDDDNMQRFDADTDAIDFWESLESMRVSLTNPIAVSGSSRDGDNFIIVDSGTSASNISNRGNLNVVSGDPQPEVIPIHVNPHVLRDFVNPRLNTRDCLSSVVGLVDYKFGRYQVTATQPFSVVQVNALAPEVSRLKGTKDSLTVASYNVFVLDPKQEDHQRVPANLPYDDVDDDVASGRYLTLARQIVNNLNSPDIIGLQELQDGDGAELTDSSDALATLDELVQSIETVGGPKYRPIKTPGLVAAHRNKVSGELVNPTGNMPGNNLQVGLLYNPARVELVSDSVQTIVDPVLHSRDSKGPFWMAPLPLAATFRFAGYPVTVIVNHWSAKSGSSGRFGAIQPWEQLQDIPECNGNVDRRSAQATAIADWIESKLLKSSGVVVLGDFNETSNNLPLRILESRGLRNLDKLLPASDRATTWFDGYGEQIDHILVSSDLAPNAEIDIVSVNGDFWQHPKTADRFENVGASDHDPIVTRLRVPHLERFMPLADGKVNHAVSDRSHQP